MADKVSSHARFLAKAKRDLGTLYRNGEYESFIARYNQYVSHAEPEVDLIEKYYECRLKTGGHQEIVDDALLSMNEGAGHYDVHMYYLLTALLHMERYFEVIEFSDHLMAEDIPQGFRIEVASLRHRAKKALDDLKEKNETEDVETLPDIDTGDFLEMAHHAQLELLGRLTETGNAAYRGVIRGAFADVTNYELITFMLLYLKEIGDAEKIGIGKFEQHMKAAPETLPALESLDMTKRVMPGVIDKLEQLSPEFADSAKSMITSHIVHCYPMIPAFDTLQMEHAYLQELLNMVNIEYEHEAEEDIIDWIRSMEQSIALRASQE